MVSLNLAMEGDGFLPFLDYDESLSQEDSQKLLADSGEDSTLCTPPKETMAMAPPPPVRPKKTVKRISKVAKNNENKCYGEIQRVNSAPGPSSGVVHASPSLVMGDGVMVGTMSSMQHQGVSSSVLQTKNLNIFGVTQALKKYEEKDLEAVNVPISNTLFISYNVKDVTFSTSKKKRIVCLQINKKYVSKEGQDRVWNIKLQDDEIEKVLQGLSYLNREYILKRNQ